MPQLQRRMRSHAFYSSVAAAVERLEGRVLLSTYTVTTLNDSGPGSYADALDQANSHPGPDTINFGPGLNGTVSGGGLITDSLSIEGRGVGVVTMNGAFVVNNGAALDISKLTINGGSAPAVISYTFASPQPTCSITNCVVTGGQRFGIFAGNGNLIVTGSIVSGSQGVGIYNDGAGVTVINSTVSGNGGAGIGGSQALLDVRNSTIANNTGPGIDSSGQGLYLTNSTVANNMGGGIFAGDSQGVTVTNSTIVGNTATQGAGINFEASPARTATLNNTIVAGNHDANGNPSDLFSLEAPPAGNPFTGSNNLIGSGGLVNGQDGNIVGVADPKVAPLGNYGGPIQTTPPLAGSPAIDAGSNALAVGPDGQPLTADQRGYDRIFNGTVDIGADEFGLAPANPVVINLNDSGPGSLTQAILDTNIHIGPDTITFTPGLTGIIPGGTPTVTDDLTIIGPGPSMLTVNGGFSLDVYAYQIPRPRAALDASGLTIKGKVSDGDSPGAPLTLTDCALQAVDGRDLDIRRCTISGGAGVVARGRFDISDSTISDSAASTGDIHGDTSAIFVPVGGANGGSLTNCTITDNPGDGVFVEDSFVVLTGCTVSDNKGVGVFNDGSTVQLIDSTVSGSGSSGMDGGEADFFVSGSTIANNKGAGITGGGEGLTLINSTVANNSGGGIAGMAVLNATNSTIVGNSGATAAAGIAISGTTRINNSIVAGNRNGDGNASDLGGPGAFSVTGSNNLIGTGGSAGLVNGQNGNLIGVADPKLAPLGNYGWPTQTMPPLAGSPAIDAGSNALAVDASGKPLISDQRGDYRIVNGTVDIGAVELNSTPLIPGDANGDGKVGFADLLLIAQNYGKSSGQTWADGDFTGDGAVTFDDLLVLAMRYGMTRVRR